jgi:predicted hydrolase (HD superfamily)
MFMIVDKTPAEIAIESYRKNEYTTTPLGKRVSLDNVIKTLAEHVNIKFKHVQEQEPIVARMTDRMVIAHEIVKIYNTNAEVTSVLEKVKQFPNMTFTDNTITVESLQNKKIAVMETMKSYASTLGQTFTTPEDLLMYVGSMPEMRLAARKAKITNTVVETINNSLPHINGIILSSNPSEFKADDWVKWRETIRLLAADVAKAVGVDNVTEKIVFVDSTLTEQKSDDLLLNDGTHVTRVGDLCYKFDTPDNETHYYMGTEITKALGNSIIHFELIPRNTGVAKHYYTVEEALLGVLNEYDNIVEWEKKKGPWEKHAPPVDNGAGLRDVDPVTINVEKLKAAKEKLDVEEATRKEQRTNMEAEQAEIAKNKKPLAKDELLKVLKILSKNRGDMAAEAFQEYLQPNPEELEEIWSEASKEMPYTPTTIIGAAERIGRPVQTYRPNLADFLIAKQKGFTAVEVKRLNEIKKMTPKEFGTFLDNLVADSQNKKKAKASREKLEKDRIALEELEKLGKSFDQNEFGTLIDSRLNALKNEQNASVGDNRNVNQSINNNVEIDDIIIENVEMGPINQPEPVLNTNNIMFGPDEFNKATDYLRTVNNFSEYVKGMPIIEKFCRLTETISNLTKNLEDNPDTDQQTLRVKQVQGEILREFSEMMNAMRNLGNFMTPDNIEQMNTNEALHQNMTNIENDLVNKTDTFSTNMGNLTAGIVPDTTVNPVTQAAINETLKNFEVVKDAIEQAIKERSESRRRLRESVISGVQKGDGILDDPMEEQPNTDNTTQQQPNTTNNRTWARNTTRQGNVGNRTTIWVRNTTNLVNAAEDIHSMGAVYNRSNIESNIEDVSKIADGILDIDNGGLDATQIIEENNDEEVNNRNATDDVTRMQNTTQQQPNTTNNRTWARNTTRQGNARDLGYIDLDIDLDIDEPRQQRNTTNFGNATQHQRNFTMNNTSTNEQHEDESDLPLEKEDILRHLNAFANTTENMGRNNTRNMGRNNTRNMGRNNTINTGINNTDSMDANNTEDAGTTNNGWTGEEFFETPQDFSGGAGGAGRMGDWRGHVVDMLKILGGLTYELLAAAKAHPWASAGLGILFLPFAYLIYSHTHDKKPPVVVKELALKAIEEVNNIIKQTNKDTGGKSKTLDEALESVDSVDGIVEKLKALSEGYETVSKEICKKQKEYEQLNETANLTHKIDVTRNYTVLENSSIQMTEFAAGHEPTEKLTHSVTVKKLEILKVHSFVSKPPPTVSFINTTKIDSLYMIILNNAYKLYPTYRKTTRYNRGITSLGITVNNMKWPQNMITGDSSSSHNNEQFLDNLEACIDINKSAINNINFSVDNPTTMYVTKKLYGEAASKMFTFSADTNFLMNFAFGYESEVLGKPIFAINMKPIATDIVNPLSVVNKEVKLHIKSKLDEFETNPFSTYDMYIIAEHMETISLDPYGQINKN